jgi:anthranilate synthase/aminodeoxychorismate synthase-like glutamine amidotransferase
MSVLLIDNYDSFTYNIAQFVQAIGLECMLYRNDRITIGKIRELHPSKIIISPGPGKPESAGITLELIREFAGKIPVLGVCLGHQAIAEAFAGKVVRSKRAFHGKVSRVRHCGSGIFAGVPSPMSAARYHSLIVDRASLPSCFEVSAETEDGIIMGLRHRAYALEGLQFHPESIATEYGQQILRNFLC